MTKSNLEKNVEFLEKKVSHNDGKIRDNSQRIHQNTSALEILHSVKETALISTNRFFVMWIITFFSLLVSVGYIIYLHNDISKVTTQEVEQDTSEGSNYYVGGDVNG